ncbi:conserved hypothetical protein [Leishmania major strain Friedlin]|uniref:Uncharacterized protein n=1 Tax=Leishmania major TaxID=5664 RepID=Q4Q644_LEIMA|nr:conserved hypothetical protein [Leishmania major strain Friedlin]CAG9579393.1 ARM-like_helical_domain-containing_protein [Leishmania major strain Friedlin]CAJ08406.1 conserved hypothetical protein [Leishmania major strain Friedlin]|eukprot:XP_001685204.1 conserved hypothetical protein [Leishmania major strain Friedlin]
MHRISSLDELLQHVESLSHHSRCATLVEFGRCSVTETTQEPRDLQNVIATLGAPSQGPYQHFLAACALCGAFAETQRAGRAMPAALLATASSLLEDASLKVSQLLMTCMLISTPSNDQQRAAMTINFLQGARLLQFKCLVTRLARAQQTQVLLRLYQTHTVTEPAKTQLLLGSLSPEAFEQLPKEEQATLTIVALRLLCRHHPQWVAQYLTARVNEQVSLNATVDAVLKELVQKACVFLATRGALKDSLSLFTATAHLLGLDQPTLQTVLERYYVSTFPVEIGHYLLEGEGRHMLATFSEPLNCLISRRAWRRLGGHTDLLLRLLDKNILSNEPVDLLNMLPEARRAYFARGCRELQDTRGIPHINWIFCMPSAAERTAFAHRFYNHARLQDLPSERIECLSFLSFPEALRIGAAYVTSNNATIRSQLIRACLGSLRYYPEHLPAALAFCVQRPNEQDGWRREMFKAWAALPHGFWRRTVTHISDETLQDTLTQLIQAAYNAKDMSDSTLRALEKLLFRLVGPQTNFAVSQLATLIRKRKQFTACNADGDDFLQLAQLYPRAVPVLVASLLSLAQMLLGSDNMWATIRILESLLDNKTVVKVLRREVPASSNGESEVWSMVHDVLKAGMSSTDNAVARVSLRLYARHFPQQLAVALPDLIAQRKDWVTVSRVQRLVCDVLQGPLLDMLVIPIENIPSGRFYHANNNSLAFVCELPVGNAHRWTSRQQIRYAQSCLQAIYTPLALEAFQCRRFIKNLARLPSVSATTSWTDTNGRARSLLTLATEAHPVHGEYAMRFALQALGQLDGDAAAVQALQNALDVAGQRMDALRALATTLRRAPSAEAVRILEPVLTGRQVTAQKEALHLLGAKRDNVAYARIVQFAAERHLPMPAEEDGDCGRVAALSAAAATAPGSTEEAVPAMHRDVRGALVTALFHFLDKPQVWSYYTFIVAHDQVAERCAVGAAEPATNAREESDGDTEDASTADSYEKKQVTTPSSAACVAMSTLPWALLRLPWQVQEYQKLLRRLLRHPMRDVRVSALHKLATVPPYDDLALCKAIAEYLDECTSPEIVQSALRGMFRCSAKEAAPFLISVILTVQPDATLTSVANVLCRIMRCAAAHEHKLLRTVATEVVEQLIAARRQPTIAVSLIFELDISEWVPRLTTMEAAKLMHPGAAVAVIRAVQGDSSAIRDMDAAERLEQEVLRTHPSALMRRLGLAILLEACEKRGWSEDRKLSLGLYCKDTDLWVSSDACIVRQE